jgi:hypothetical protein
MLHVLRPCLLQGIQGIWIGRSSRNKLQVLLRRQREVQAARRESLARARAALSSPSLPPTRTFLRRTKLGLCIVRSVEVRSIDHSHTRRTGWIILDDSDASNNSDDRRDSRVAFIKSFRAPRHVPVLAHVSGLCLFKHKSLACPSGQYSTNVVTHNTLQSRWCTRRCCIKRGESLQAQRLTQLIKDIILHTKDL